MKKNHNIIVILFFQINVEINMSIENKNTIINFVYEKINVLQILNEINNTNEKSSNQFKRNFFEYYIVVK